MPQGKGTYGSKVGRPPKKKGSLLNDDREQYGVGGILTKIAKVVMKPKASPKGSSTPKLIENKQKRLKELREAQKDLYERAEEGYPSGVERETFQMWERNLFDEIEEVTISLEKLGKKLTPDEKTSLRLEKRTKKAEGGEGMTAEEAMKVSIKSLVNDEEKNYPKKIINESLNRIVDNAANEGVNRTAVIDALKAERNRRFEERREAAIEANPLLEKRQIRNEGGELDDQMSMLMEGEETHTMPDGTVMPGATHEEYEQMLPDEQMEEDYVDYVMQETLSNEDRNYLISALEKDDRLSEIFDQVVESATEFSGSGPIEGPGNEKSDSIPARLSDGEFVMTAKATEEIGEDNLMSMMKDAEAVADQRQSVAYGGMIDEEDQAVPLPTQGSRAAQGNVPSVVKQSRQVEEEMLKSSPRRYYVPVSG